MLERRLEEALLLVAIERDESPPVEAKLLAPDFDVVVLLLVACLKSTNAYLESAIL